MNNKITYKQVKEKQTEDIKSKTSRYMIYRKFSTPFTYAFLKFGISPAAISIINFFPLLIGFFLLSVGNYFFIFLGLLFFILFKVLDCSDGEVARIQDPKAMEGTHKKIEGIYFDIVGHFIFPICIGMGLGIGLYNLYGSKIYITLGVIMSILFTLEISAMNELVKSFLRKGIIERKISRNLSDKDTYSELVQRINEGRSWSNGNFFSRMFGIHPFQGLLYSNEFIAPLLMILVLTEYFLSSYAIVTLHIYGQTFGILSIYILITIIVKIIYSSRFIYKMKKKEYITNFLIELQKSK